MTLLAHERRVNGVLRAAFVRHGAPEPVDHRCPVTALVEKEEAAADRAIAERDARLETTRRMMSFFFAGGPHPATVAQRVFAYAKKYSPELLVHMSVRDLGAMWGNSHATWSWWMRQLFERPACANGAHGGLTATNKSASAKESMRAARVRGHAAGQHPRRFARASKSKTNKPKTKP